MNNYDRKIKDLTDLAADLDDMAEVAKSLDWDGTASRMIQTASSIRWQIKWERKRLEGSNDSCLG
jgi:hypothetical protein